MSPPSICNPGPGFQVGKWSLGWILGSTYSPTPDCLVQCKTCPTVDGSPGLFLCSPPRQSRPSTWRLSYCSCRRRTWQIDGEKGDTVTNFFLGSKITVDGDCSHEIKRHLLPGRKAMTKLDSVLKRDIILYTKVHLIKAIGFPLVMCRCESWTIKKAEC